MTITKTIPMAAMGKARPKVTRNGTYMPKRYEKWRYDFRMLFGPFDVSGLVHLDVRAFRKLPKRTKNKPGDYCKPGPDADNIAGAVMDALFEDDSLVVSLYCDKRWGEADCLEVTITEAE